MVATRDLVLEEDSGDGSQASSRRVGAGSRAPWCPESRPTAWHRRGSWWPWSTRSLAGPAHHVMGEGGSCSGWGVILEIAILQLPTR